MSVFARSFTAPPPQPPFFEYYVLTTYNNMFLQRRGGNPNLHLLLKIDRLGGTRGAIIGSDGQKAAQQLRPATVKGGRAVTVAVGFGDEDFHRVEIEDRLGAKLVVDGPPFPIPAPLILHHIRVEVGVDRSATSILLRTPLIIVG